MPKSVASSVIKDSAFFMWWWKYFRKHQFWNLSLHVYCEYLSHNFHFRSQFHYDHCLEDIILFLLRFVLNIIIIINNFNHELFAHCENFTFVNLRIIQIIIAYIYANLSNRLMLNLVLWWSSSSSLFVLFEQIAFHFLSRVLTPPPHNFTANFYRAAWQNPWSERFFFLSVSLLLNATHFTYFCIF